MIENKPNRISNTGNVLTFQPSNLAGLAGTTTLFVDASGVISWRVGTGTVQKISDYTTTSILSGYGVLAGTQTWSGVNTFSAAINSFTNSVGIGTATDVASSLLTLASTTKGILIPRMTTTQRNAVSSPATGLQVFDSTVNKNSVYNGTAWVYEVTNTTSYPIIISNAFSQVGTATTTFTVSIGQTLANTNYEVNVTPTNLLSAAVFYVNNKTTTTFDVVYLTGLTGNVTFDFSVFP